MNKFVNFKLHFGKKNETYIIIFYLIYISCERNVQSVTELLTEQNLFFVISR